MKRINLSVQIAVIFLIAFIMTYALLAINIVSRLDEIFEINVFDQLESSAKELAASAASQQADIPDLFAYITYSSSSNVYGASANISEFISDDYAELLINKAVIQSDSVSRYKNLINDKQIYYVIVNYESFFGVYDNNIFIVLTDETLKSDMVKETAMQILVACLLAYLLGYLLIYLWISRLVSTTKNIAKSLNKMGKNHYKTKITTNRTDEIGDLVESIETMRKKIINNEKSKQEIIQGVSHDLKTPIAIIQSHAEALQDGIYSPEKVSDITLKQCAWLNAKVKKLLALTRIGYLDMYDIEFGYTDMRKLIEDEIQLYSNKSPAEITFNSPSYIFLGDEESWRIVLENLLDNAVRYAQKRIIISLGENTLSVFNDGLQIPQEKIGDIFNAYEKGPNGNFGLGLSIVKRTVNLFGYNIATANIDDGVRFTISRQ